MKGIIRPRVEADGRVTVDMGEPAFGPEAVHFKSEGHSHLTRDKDTLWQVKTPEGDVWLSLVSMGNPHAVMVCGDTETACVETIGEALQKDEDFTQKVNVGFLQALSRSEARLRVYERGAGETLACGTGACAAAVTGMRRGMFDEAVEITMHGGKLRISWAGPGHHVYLTGPAEVVFEGTVETDNLPVMPA